MLRSKKNFGKKFFGPKIFWVIKFFGQKIFWVIKFFGKKHLGQKDFDKKFFGEKKKPGRVNPRGGYMTPPPPPGKK